MKILLVLEALNWFDFTKCTISLNLLDRERKRRNWLKCVVVGVKPLFNRETRERYSELQGKRKVENALMVQILERIMAYTVQLDLETFIELI